MSAAPATNVHSSVEEVVGSSSDDTLIGNDQANVLVGGAGAAPRRAAGGGDTVQANDGQADAVIDCGGGVTFAQLDALLPGNFALLVAALLVFVNIAPNTWQIRIKPRVWQGMAAGIGAAVAIMTISQPHPFIYFQF